MGAFATSRELTAKTYGLVKAEPHLKRWSVRALAYGALFGALGVVPGGIALAVGLPTEADPAAGIEASTGNTAVAIAGGIVLFAGMVAAMVASNLQMAGLVVSSDAVMHNRPVDDDASRATVRSHRASVVSWSVISAVVSVLVGALRGNGDNNVVTSILRSLLAGLVAAAWTVMTMLVLPVIVLENTGAVAAIKRSASLVRKAFGTTVIGGARIGLRFALMFTLPGVVIIVAGVVAGIAVGGPTGVAIGFVAVVVGLALILIGAVRTLTCRTVFGVALYYWANANEAVGPFTAEELASSVRTKG